MYFMKASMKFLPLLVCFMAFLSSCRHDVVVPESPEISFKFDVQAIIVGNCTESGCHSAGSDQPNPLVTYDDVMRSVNQGDARNSQLYQRIVGKSGNLMPPSPKRILNENEIKLIYVWIEQGAKNN